MKLEQLTEDLTTQINIAIENGETFEFLKTNSKVVSIIKNIARFFSEEATDEEISDFIQETIEKSTAQLTKITDIALGNTSCPTNLSVEDTKLAEIANKAFNDLDNGIPSYIVAQDTKAQVNLLFSDGSSTNIINRDTDLYSKPENESKSLRIRKSPSI